MSAKRYTLNRGRGNVGQGRVVVVIVGLRCFHLSLAFGLDLKGSLYILEYSRV